MTVTHPLRVLYLEPSALVSGGGIALLRVIEALDKSAFQPLVVLGSNGPLVDQFKRIPGCTVFCRPLPERLSRVTRFNVISGGLRSIGSALVYGLAVRHLADRWKAHVVHSNGLKMHLLSTLTARRGRVLLWHIRDLLAPPYMAPRSASLMRNLALRVPDAVVCNSESTRYTITSGCAGGSRPATRVHTVFDGIHCTPLREATARDHKRVLMLGRIAEWKGQHVFVEAAQHLAARATDTQLLMAGGATTAADLEYERRLRALVETARLSDRVKFLGVVHDVPGLLQTVDLVVHCSVSPEPFGLVIIEAMAAAVPVVASNLGGPSEIIQDGVNGRLYAAGDARALAQIVGELLCQPDTRRRLGSAGRTTVEERFAVGRTAQELGAIYCRYARTIAPD